MYKNEVFVRFVITSEIVYPEDITNALNMKPDKSWNINTPTNENTTITHKKNKWEIFIKANNIYDTEPLLEQLITLLSPIKEDIVALKNIEKMISIVIYREKNMPAINYNPNIISFLNEIKVSLDVDIY